MLNSFQHDLKLWGPAAEARQPLSLEQARHYTRRLALGHYENFPVVTWFLPRELRQPFYDVYAFCRWADDLGDELDSPAESLRLLSWWRNELNQSFQGNSLHPVYIALAETIRQFDLSSVHFHNLITAFERDQIQNRYESYAAVLDYCRYSANPVGRILLELIGCSSEQALSSGDALCTGLQLINFWQDVSRDWDIGRVYLPQEDLARFGVTEQNIASRECTPQFRDLLHFQVERAENLMQTGLTLGELVPRKLRIDIRLFALGGLHIAEKIRRQNFDVLSSRPRLRKTDFPLLLWRACRKS